MGSSKPALPFSSVPLSASSAVMGTDTASKVSTPDTASKLRVVRSESRVFFFGVDGSASRAPDDEDEDDPLDDELPPAQ